MSNKMRQQNAHTKSERAWAIPWHPKENCFTFDIKDTQKPCSGSASSANRLSQCLQKWPPSSTHKELVLLLFLLFVVVSSCFCHSRKFQCGTHLLSEKCCLLLPFPAASEHSRLHLNSRLQCFIHCGVLLLNLVVLAFTCTLCGLAFPFVLQLAFPPLPSHFVLAVPSQAGSTSLAPA